MGSGTSISINSSPEKKRGDLAYRSGDYLEAILWYSLLLNEIEREGDAKQEKEDERSQSRIREVAILLSNRSSAYLLTGQSHRALEDALRVIEIDPLWVKGYYRAAKALESCQRVTESVEFYQKAVILSGNDPSIEGELTQLKNSTQFTLSQGNVFTWGLGDSYGLGHANLRDKHIPTMVEQLRGKHVLDISCGAMHTVAVTGTGDVYSWGQNKYGQVGTQSNENTILPTLVRSLIGVFIEAVSCGAGHTIVKSTDGRVFSWGMGGHGQLGHGNFENISNPAQIVFLTNYHVLGVSCGIAHTIFLIDGEKQSVMGCGMNTYGALGFSSSDPSVSRPTYIPYSSLMGSIVHISCGGAHTALVDDRGVLYLTGSNNCGQLGLSNNFSGDFVSSFYPVQIVQTVEKCSIPAPVFAYVSCGEEFTVAITSHRQVYSTGLGLSGQMANKTQENNSIFTHISLLDSHEVEEICCSQGTVYAVTASGAVWSWGIPGNEYLKHIASLDVKTCQSSFDHYLLPTLMTAFVRRKKGRMIRCGRKHYAAITMVPYGPASYLMYQQQRIFSSNPQDGIIEIGKKLNVVVLSCDIRGDPVDFSGAVVNGNLQLVESEDTIRWGKDLFAMPLNIDDNFDGTFTIQSAERIEVSGCYKLSLFIDGLHIDCSPFQLHALSDLVSKMNLQFEIDGSPIATFGINQMIDMKISFLDRFGNMKPNPGDHSQCLLKIEMIDNLATTISTKTIPITKTTLETESKISVPFQTPSRYGLYQCVVSLVFTFRDEKQSIKEIVPIHLEGRKYSPLHSVVSLPPNFIVDEEIMITIYWKDPEGEDIPIHSGDLDSRPKVISTITPTESKISARALIQLYTWNQDPCRPVRGDILWDEDSSSVKICHKVRVAGLAEMKIIVDNYIVQTSKIVVRSGYPSSLFTELLNPKTSLSPWAINEEKRDFIFQLRDQFGNITTHEQVQMIASEWPEGKEPKKQELLIEKKDHLFFLEVVKLQDDHSELSWIDVSISSPAGWEKLQYSPFCLGSTSIDLVSQPDIPKSVVLNSPDQVLKVESLARSELTKKRATEALKEKQRLLREEKERNRIKRAARRTGGGFIIQYSKEV